MLSINSFKSNLQVINNNRSFATQNSLNSKTKTDTVCFKGDDFNEALYNKELNKAAEKLKTAKNVAIFCHVSPDGDAISSSAAMLNMVKRLPNIEKATVFIMGDTPSQFNFLEDTVDFVNIYSKEQMEKYKGKYETVVTVDTATKERLGHGQILFEEAENTIKFDHHPPRENYAQINAVNNKTASATEVLTDFAKTLGLKLEKEPILCKELYTGLLTDTGGLRYIENPKRTFKDCMELASSGINLPQIYQKAIDFIPKSVVPLYKKIVNSMNITEDGKFLTLKIDPNDADYKADRPSAKNLFKSLTSQLLAIEGVEVAAGLTKVNGNQTGVSLRSKNASISPIAESYGGGGHHKASGCGIDKPVNQAEAELTQKVKETLEGYENKQS